MKSAPAADVVYENGGETHVVALNVGEQLNQSITPFQAKTTFTGVRINFDDFEGVRRRVELDCV
ncbi:hypothetical protein D3C77_778160 [compost metagenome]